MYRIVEVFLSAGLYYQLQYKKDADWINSYLFQNQAEASKALRWYCTNPEGFRVIDCLAE